MKKFALFVGKTFVTGVVIFTAAKVVDDLSNAITSFRLKLKEKRARA